MNYLANLLNKNPALVRAGFFIFIVIGSLVSCTRPSENYAKRVVLQVNDLSMTASEFANALADQLKDFDALAVKDQPIVDRAKNEVIRSFIIRAITTDWAKNKQLFIRQEDLDQEITKIRRVYPDDLAFRRALAEEGQTFEEWKEQLKYSLLQKLVSDDLRKEIAAPEDKEIKDYYDNHKDEFKSGEEVQIRQIVLDSENNARRILEELKSGKKLDVLAKKYSIAPEAAKGGDIGWIEKGTLDIFDQAFTMKVGGRSPIMKSSYGYHIFEVIGKRPARVRPVDEVKNRIRRQLMEKREQAAYAAWLEKQVRRAKVFKDEKLIAGIYVQTRSQ